MPVMPDSAWFQQLITGPQQMPQGMGPLMPQDEVEPTTVQAPMLSDEGLAMIAKKAQLMSKPQPMGTQVAMAMPHSEMRSPQSMPASPQEPLSMQDKLKKSFQDMRDSRMGDIEQLQNQLGRLSPEQAPVNLKPLLAWADTVNNTRTADSYAPPVNESLRSKLKDQIEKAKSDVQGNDLKLLEALNKRELGDDRNENMAKASQAKVSQLGNTDEARNARIHNDNLKQLDDKYAQNLLTTYNNLANAKSNFEVGGANANEFHELQQAVRSNLGIKGQSTGVERKDTYLRSLGINAAAMKQFLTSENTDIRSYSPELVDAVMTMVNNEMDLKRKAVEEHIATKSAGQTAFYSRPGNAGRKADYQSFINNRFKQFGGGQQQNQSPTGQSASQGPKVGQEEDGFIFEGGDPKDPKSWRKK